MYELIVLCEIIKSCYKIFTPNFYFNTVNLKRIMKKGFKKYLLFNVFTLYFIYFSIELVFIIKGKEIL